MHEKRYFNCNTYRYKYVMPQKNKNKDIAKDSCLGV